MRAIRGKIGVVAALVLAVALALSALAGLGARPREVLGQGPWLIELRDAQGDWQVCFDDPAVTSPTAGESTVVVASAPGATEADIQRVLDCLSGALTGGSVQVGTIAPADA